MKLTLKHLLVLLLSFSMLFVQSCSDDSEIKKPGTEGFFIVNEGGWGNGNTSVSFYDSETDQVTNDLFAAVNERPLGDQAQSLTVFNDKAYIVVQGSGKVEVIDAKTYTSMATIIEGIESPRYFIGVSSKKGYISDWGTDGESGTVKVIDLSTNKVTGSIATGKGSNRMLKVGNLVYVTNNGGYGTDNTVKVIDTNTDAVTATITVGDNPNSIQRDNSGNLWVTSSGNTVYNEDWSIDEVNSSKGSISKIDNNVETLRLTFSVVSYGGPGNLSISPDGKTLYYLYNNALYSISSTATTLPTTPLVDKNYYGLAVNPSNGNIVGTLAPNFSSAGSIDVLDASGSLIKSYTVGIGPNSCAFK